MCQSYSVVVPNNISKNISFHLQWDLFYFNYVKKTTNEKDKNYTMSDQIDITRCSDNNIRKHPCILTDSDVSHMSIIYVCELQNLLSDLEKVKDVQKTF